MKNSEIGEVLKDGQTYRSNSFILRVLPTVSGKNKPAFIAGKKIFKTAVSRNKARRRLRAATQVFIKDTIKGNKLVFVINNNVLITKTKDLEDEVKRVFSRF